MSKCKQCATSGIGHMDFCNQECRKKFYDATPRRCGFCEKKIELRSRIHYHYLMYKKADTDVFCDKSCRNKFRYGWKTHDDNLMTCANEKCKKIFRVDTIRGEKPLCCSKKCFCEKRKADTIKQWLRGERYGNYSEWKMARWVRAYLYETRGEKCEECGWAKRNRHSGKINLEIDHVDGDFSNNRPENLKILCRNCHSLTPTFCYLNRGNGRRTKVVNRPQIMKKDGTPANYKTYRAKVKNS